MTKNQQIEKRAVKLWAEFSGNKPEPELPLNLHLKHIAFFRKLARKLIRLEEKVKEQKNAMDKIGKTLNQTIITPY